MARIPYDFTPFPRKLHPGWAGRSHASWGLCVRLWLLADGQPIQVHGADWRASLCQQMGLGGRDRPTTRALMADLQVDGLLSLVGGFVHVKFLPDQGRPGTTEQAPELVAEGSARGSTGVVPGVRQESYPREPSVENHSTSKTQTDRQTEKTERARAHASENPGFRTPLPEPPPDLPPAEQPIGEWIATEHAKRYAERTGASPGGANRYRMAVDIARWVEGNSEAYRLSNRALATKLLDGLFASERAASKRWPLSWILTDPAEFCGTPKAVALPGSKSNNPTHQVWRPPDYEAEIREAEERSKREREEWFREHPEDRAHAEAYEREIQALAKQRPVVVSIAEAKPPVAAYRPKSPEELAARRALLEEQARALKAASAAE